MGETHTDDAADAAGPADGAQLDGTELDGTELNGTELDSTEPGRRSLLARIPLRTRILLAILVGIPTFGLAYFALVVVPMPGTSWTGEVTPTDADLERGERLEQTVRVLAEEIGPRHTFEPEGLEAAEDWIRQALGAAADRPVEDHVFEVVPTTDEQRVWSERRTEVANLYVTFEGTSQPDAVIVVGAHYDTAPDTFGANDNGSGVAALLEIAAAFVEDPPDRTVLLVAFVNEEPPWFQTSNMGSWQFANHLAERDTDVIGMISLETMGAYYGAEGSQRYPMPFDLFYPSTGDFTAIVGNVASGPFVRWFVERFREHARLPSEGASAPGWLPGVFWSDHMSFWRHDWPALMVSDTAPFRYTHYHRYTDVPDELNYPHFAIAVDGVIAVLHELAAADGPRF